MNVIEQDMAPNLADKEIWIIDDDIPIHRAEFEHRDMLEGIRPIDRGTLRALLTVQWDDPAVKLICDQLLKEARNVTAFVQPGHAIEYLDSGAPIPDAIIYDMKYQTLSKELALEYLERLLRGCVATVQVYTKEPTEEALRELEPSMKKFPNRLVNPENKVQTNAKKIAQIIDDQLKTSLSASLSKRIRTLSLMAIENVLVKIDDLPIAAAISLLAGDTETPEEIEGELIELLSQKVSEQLESSSELATMLDKYVSSKGISADRTNEAVQEMVALIKAQVHEHIRYDNGLLTAIRSAHKIERQPESAAELTRIATIVKDFFAFRLYSHPKDNVVRTGDIVALQSEATNPPDLYLIVTPPCDLARFWKKTRGSLTMVKMQPRIDQRGLTRERIYGNSSQTISSIINRAPLVFPTLPVSADNVADYVLFSHEFHHIGFEDAASINAKTKEEKLRAEVPLTYAALGGKLVRKCRISEPFLAGVLAQLQHELFRPGIPDFPEQEKKRLNG